MDMFVLSRALNEGRLEIDKLPRNSNWQQVGQIEIRCEHRPGHCETTRYIEPASRGRGLLKLTWWMKSLTPSSEDIGGGAGIPRSGLK